MASRKRPTKAEREAFEKRSAAAKKAAATRARNRRAAEREEARARKARSERAKRAAVTRAANARRAEAARKPKRQKKRKRTPADYAEAARLGWERRRERAAIQAELPIDTSTWVDILTPSAAVDRAQRKGLTLERTDEGVFGRNSGGDLYRSYGVRHRITDEIRIFWTPAETLAGFASPAEFTDLYEDLDPSVYEVIFDVSEYL